MAFGQLHYGERFAVALFGLREYLPQRAAVASHDFAGERDAVFFHRGDGFVDVIDEHGNVMQMPIAEFLYPGRDDAGLSTLAGERLVDEERRIALAPIDLGEPVRVFERLGVLEAVADKLFRAAVDVVGAEGEMIHDRPDADAGLAQHFVEHAPGGVAGKEISHVFAQQFFEVLVGLMRFEFVSFHFVVLSVLWSRCRSARVAAARCNRHRPFSIR